MHIPDGYLGPQTYIACAAVVVPVWLVASAKLKTSLRSSQVPFLALGAAFSFVIMMFNIPIPGGTTGHAVGAVLLAILLGPWAAVIGVSLALIVQALLFGDGGVTAIGANCLTMAVIMPFTGWATYRLIAGNAPATSLRRGLAGAAGGYVGLNAAAFATGTLVGLQPMLAHDAAGRALYSPFGLSVALPAMVGEHVVLFGFVEAIATGLVLRYFQRTDPARLVPDPAALEAPRSLLKRLAIGLGILTLLSPLGLILPKAVGAGAAWGEWGSDELKDVAGYVPVELARIESTWRAPLPDYAPPDQAEPPMSRQVLTYVGSGVLGGLVLVGFILALRRPLASPDRAS